MLDENARTQDGTIRPCTQFAAQTEDLIISGPHFSVANFFAKTPRSVCTVNLHYDPLDLTSLPEDYLPRTNFVVAQPKEVFFAKWPKEQWSHLPVTNHFRFMCRRQLSQSGERTLISSIAPRFASHLNTIISLAFTDAATLVSFAAGCSSIPFDFFIKSTGRSDAYEPVLRGLPAVCASPALAARTLLLNCLTRHYSDLWKECFETSFNTQSWTKEDPRLCNDRFGALQRDWSWATPLRTDYERRQALIEIDVLIARTLGLALEELGTIYRIQFPVLRKYEANTFYDRRGRIVYLDGDSSFGFRTPDWRGIVNLKSGLVSRTIQDDTLPGGSKERAIEYEAPFDRCDREADYATAWKFFDEAGI